MAELKHSSQIDSKQSTVFLLYSRHWHFCKYSRRYIKEKVEKEKKNIMKDLLKNIL